MKEDDVFWLRGTPGANRQPEQLADTPEFVTAIRNTCETAGCPVERLVSAKGPYGTWLVEIQRHGQDQRVLWNGKDRKLVLQVPLPQGGWEDAVAMEVQSQDTPGFVAGVSAILAL